MIREDTELKCGATEEYCGQVGWRKGQTRAFLDGSPVLHRERDAELRQLLTFGGLKMSVQRS